MEKNGKILFNIWKKIFKKDKKRCIKRLTVRLLGVIVYT